MSITYIIVTVTLGWPFVTGLCAAAGLQHEWARYISETYCWIFVECYCSNQKVLTLMILHSLSLTARFVDALIYIWLPQ